MGRDNLKGKKRYFKGNECKYFFEGCQPNGWVLGTPEKTKNIQSQKTKELWKNEDYYKKQNESRNSIDFHNKMSVISKNSWEQDKEIRTINIKNATNLRYENKEERDNCSKRMKNLWQNEEYRKNQSEKINKSHKDIYIKHPEYKTKLSISNTQTWSKYKEQILLKQNNTKRENKSFNTSQPEEEYYEELCKEYGSENVKRQYYDAERYPYNCDFYIPSEDLFIELNKHWSHGGHFFDCDNKNDLQQLEEWEEKAKNSLYYKKAIYVWTKSDIAKRQIAKNNNLNILFVY